MQRERGDNAAILELRRQHHARLPSVTTYQRFRDHAASLCCWDSDRDNARALVEQRDLGSYIDILLDDGETEVAWHTVEARPDAKLDIERLRRLADARACRHTQPTPTACTSRSLKPSLNPPTAVRTALPPRR